MAQLRQYPPAEQRRLLDGDWQLHQSDAGDLLVQFGSGLHGLPFVEVDKFFLSLRTGNKQLRAVEVLNMGPMKRVTTCLQGDIKFMSEGLVLEYTGLIDKDGYVCVYIYIYV